MPQFLLHSVAEGRNKMEESKVIERLMEQTDWANSLVVVEKPNGKLRICLDPKVLKMTGAKFFSKLDA